MSKLEYVTIVGLLAWAVVATAFAINYYLAYQSVSRVCQELRAELSRLTVYANLLIDFGNGTCLWYNDTPVPMGSTLLNLTLAVAEVEYSTYGPYLDFPDVEAVFVDAINGVSGNETHAWFWWRWNVQNRTWVFGEVGCNHPSVAVRNGSTFAWAFRPFSTWPPPPPGT